MLLQRLALLLLASGVLRDFLFFALTNSFGFWQREMCLELCFRLYGFRLFEKPCFGWG
jgi:hypothetical protein